MALPVGILDDAALKQEIGGDTLESTMALGSASETHESSAGTVAPDTIGVPFSGPAPEQTQH
eukprot:11566809-Prorocentrum_lima.AAC.1